MLRARAVLFAPDRPAARLERATPADRTADLTGSRERPRPLDRVAYHPDPPRHEHAHVRAASNSGSADPPLPATSEPVSPRRGHRSLEKEFRAAETGLQNTGIWLRRPVSETGPPHPVAEIPRMCGLSCGGAENHENAKVPGGADEIRTHDLCSAIAALSHLSYSPGARGCTSGDSPCQQGRRCRFPPQAS